MYFSCHYNPTILNKLLLFIITASLFFSCKKDSSQSKTATLQANIIPKPSQISVLEGAFIWDEPQTIYADSIGTLAQEFLLSYMSKTPFELKKADQDKASITVLYREGIPNEGYELVVKPTAISIFASDMAGAFYAVQSLRQLMPPSLENGQYLNSDSFPIALATITDAPKFKYRGMHLDVGRHFFEVDDIKAYIDMLALLKMNRFHWHLTEDQGWRIEIKKYPKLQTHAAFRDQTLVGHYNDSPQTFDGKKYGGYYTQEEVKDIVAYASSLNITVIPEIEMPGHAQAAISAYPSLGCTGEPIKVAQKWGVFEDIYCPKPETFQFLKDVLDEVIPLFPGEYIHIGGDEAPKTRWDNCDHCQRLIAQEQLGDSHGLQSYFISQMEAYLNSKGKQIIGWDEILEGGLAPNATVMSWRGTSGAVEAAKEGHNVILTPTSHAYFDYYQDTSPDEPLAIGGYLPLKKVYGFSPFPAEMEENSKKFVLGAQGNVWTEYMPDFKKVQYMAYPRTMAMSEVVWSGPSSNLEKDYPNFLERLELAMFPRLDNMGVNYANHLNNLEGKVKKKNDSLFYKLIPSLENKAIVYTLNGSDHIDYTGLIPITEPSAISANVFKNDSLLGRSFEVKVNPHKGTYAKVSLDKTPHPSYNAGGVGALNDGVLGSSSRYGDDQWLGFWGDDLAVKIEFSEPTKINLIDFRFYHAPGQWIYKPDHIAVRVHLPNGEVVAHKFLLTAQGNLATTEYKKATIECSWIEVLVPNYGVIPEGKQGAGNKAWTFIDEIIIN